MQTDGPGVQQYDLSAITWLRRERVFSTQCSPSCGFFDNKSLNQRLLFFRQQFCVRLTEELQQVSHVLRTQSLFQSLGHG